MKKPFGQLDRTGCNLLGALAKQLAGEAFLIPLPAMDLRTPQIRAKIRSAPPTNRGRIDRIKNLSKTLQVTGTCLGS